jgi:Ribonuclease G/E
MIKRCPSCHGSKKMMGGGMLIKDCDVCNGSGNISTELNASIDAIRAIDPQISEEKAKEILKQEMDDLDKKLKDEYHENTHSKRIKRSYKKTKNKAIAR